MGGIIEDRIFEVLMRNRMSAREVQSGLSAIRYERTYGVVARHLSKMVSIRQLERKLNGGQYVYWNPAMVGARA